MPDAQISDEEKQSICENEADKPIQIRLENSETISSENEALGTGKEVAIQTNAHEIERSSGQLPLRKRFVPLRFSDYCVFANNVNEEEEDSNFTPTETISKKPSNNGDDKHPRSQGRSRKLISKNSTDDCKTTDNDNGKGEYLKKHSITKVSNGFKCCTCGRIFSLRGNAKAHLITHTDERPFKCDFEDCEKKLRTKESLRRHKMSHLGIKTFECSECKKKFSCNLSLQEHMNLHTGEKPLSCVFCGEKFRQVAVLKRHITTHSSKKPFACEICDKRFSLKVYVRSHMKTHTGERPHACDICNKSFAHLSDLNRHKIIHTGKKPYECSVCSMRYNDPSSRRRHEREHQSKHQYVCEICKQQFPRAGQLRVHLIKEHTTATVDHQQGITFKEEIRDADSHEKPPSWDPGDDSNTNKLLTDQPSVVHTIPSAEVSLDLKTEKAMAETLQVVLDTSTARQIGTGQEVASIPVENLANINNSVQTMVMEIPTNAEEFSGLPSNGTYKVISAGNGNQVFELQIEKEAQMPFQEFSNEMKINLSNIKISDGLVAFIQDGNTVTVMEQTPTADQLCMDLSARKTDDQDSLVTKYINEVNSDKDMKGENSIKDTAPKDDTVTILEAPLEQHEISLGIVQNTDACLESEIEEKISGISTTPTAFDDNEAFSVSEIHYPCSEIPNAITSVFIENPDLSSQDYYNWLATFSEECKQFTMPLSKDVFQKISQVQKTLSDFMALPTGVITDKNNFKILMGITQDLSQITSSHLSFMYSNLNKQ